MRYALNILLSEGVEIVDAEYATRDEAKEALHSVSTSLASDGVIMTASKAAAFSGHQFVAAWVSTHECDEDDITPLTPEILASLPTPPEGAHSG